MAKVEQRWNKVFIPVVLTGDTQINVDYVCLHSDWIPVQMFTWMMLCIVRQDIETSLTDPGTPVAMLSSLLPRTRSLQQQQQHSLHYNTPSLTCSHTLRTTPTLSIRPSHSIHFQSFHSLVSQRTPPLSYKPPQLLLANFSTQRACRPFFQVRTYAEEASAKKEPPKRIRLKTLSNYYADETVPYEVRIRRKANVIRCVSSDVY